jgi:hypothetical protein
VSKAVGVTRQQYIFFNELYQNNSRNTKPIVTACDFRVERLARDFARASKSAATRSAYQKDFVRFTAWCAERHLSSIPATPDVAAFLVAQAVSGISRQQCYPLRPQARPPPEAQEPLNSAPVKFRMPAVAKFNGHCGRRPKNPMDEKPREVGPR